MAKKDNSKANNSYESVLKVLKFCADKPRLGYYYFTDYDKNNQTSDMADKFRVVFDKFKYAPYETDLSYYDMIAKYYPIRKQLHQVDTVEDDYGSKKKVDEIFGSTYYVEEDKLTRDISRRIYECDRGALYISQTTTETREPSILASIRNKGVKKSVSASNYLIAPEEDVSIVGKFGVDDIDIEDTKKEFWKNCSYSSQQMRVLARTILISRIDSSGGKEKIHLNNIYAPCIDSPESKVLAKNYFMHNGSKEIPTPHFHFNTYNQSIMLQNQEAANAIHIDEILKYLKDLCEAKIEEEESLNDPNKSYKVPPILLENMGMPFLKIIDCPNVQIDKNLLPADVFNGNADPRKIMNIMSMIGVDVVGGNNSKSTKNINGIEYIYLLFNAFKGYRDHIYDKSTTTQEIADITSKMSHIIAQSATLSLSRTMTYEMCAGGGSDCEELKFDYGEYMHNLRWLYKLGKITKSEFKELVVDEPNQTMFDLVKDDYEMARQSNKL